jgi:hypothetical protein
LVLEDYSIWNKIRYFTGNNHGSNDVLCTTLGNFMKEKKNIIWLPKHRCIRCHGYVINLIVQAFLFIDSKEAVGLTQGSRSGCDRQQESDQNSVDKSKTMLKTKERSGRYWA